SSFIASTFSRSRFQRMPKRVPMISVSSLRAPPPTPRMTRPCDSTIVDGNSRMLRHPERFEPQRFCLSRYPYDVSYAIGDGKCYADVHDFDNAAGKAVTGALAVAAA